MNNKTMQEQNAVANLAGSAITLAIILAVIWWPVTELNKYDLAGEKLSTVETYYIADVSRDQLNNHYRFQRCVAQKAYQERIAKRAGFYKAVFKCESTNNFMTKAVNFVRGI